MRILQLSAFDTRFGAAIAARRLHEALLSNGQQCDLLVREQRGTFPRTHVAFRGIEKLMARLAHRMDNLPASFYGTKSSYFSPGWTPNSIARQTVPFSPEVIHMHWCQTNYVPVPALPEFGRPIVWTFHDMWAFTGGCHYSDGCTRYLQECGACPILKSTNENDLSRRVWQLKRETYKKVRPALQVVCPSNWMAGLARKAPVLEGVPVHAIPNPIDTTIFKATDKRTARREFGLPESGPLLLMGAAGTTDRRKGFDLLDEALGRYAALPGSQPVGLVTLGDKTEATCTSSGKLRMIHLDFIHDEPRLAELYNAVDVLALPSREENLSNALAEALCCGVPCLAFDIGGNGDLVKHQVNGYLARPNDTADMATGLGWVLANLGSSRQQEISSWAQGRLAYEKLVPEFLRIYEAGVANFATA